MQRPDFLGRGWSFPLTLQEGQVAISSGEINIKESIRIILQTAKGERLMQPDFGSDLHKLLFAPLDETTLGLAKYYVKESLEVWEPRIIIENIDTYYDNQQRSSVLINVDYLVKLKNSPDNLVFPFYLLNR